MSFRYHLAGRKTQMVDGIGTTNYTYDNANRLTQVGSMLTGGSATLTT